MSTKEIIKCNSDRKTKLQYSLPVILINFSVDLGMENILYVKQESRMKQQILGVHIVGLREWEGGRGWGEDLVVYLHSNHSNQQAI